MRATGWPLSRLELAWGGFAAANLAAMSIWPNWETIPFHFVWISLTLLYGFRVWRPQATALVLSAVFLATGALILTDAFEGIQLWGELFEVPLMSAMFLAMVWHARRRQAALGISESLLAQQERFVHDASHELRTPVTIARGHLELLSPSPEIDVALEELARIDRIVDHLLLLARAERPDFLVAESLDLEMFLEDVFLRWSEVAPRAWRLGPLATGRLSADPHALRTALDALLENAVAYTEPRDAIELRSRAEGVGVAIEVVDEGCGIEGAARERIFERFARADTARSRDHGGVGLGLAIVDTIARAHGGRCTVECDSHRTVFALRLPAFSPASVLQLDAAGVTSTIDLPASTLYPGVPSDTAAR
jgi:signal transduction histidine kinase